MQTKVMYGIDRTKMTIPIKCIDMDKFKANGGLVTGYYGVGKYIKIIDSSTGEYIKVKQLQIKGERGIFNNMTCGVNFTQGKEGAYAILDLTASRLNNPFRNLCPLTVEQYTTNFKELLLYLQEKYGLYLKEENYDNTYAELNITAVMDKYTFIDLHYVLNRMELCRNATFKVDTVKDDQSNEIKILYLYNHNFIIKVYDKTRELYEEHNIVTDNTYIRFEVSIRNKRTFQNIFNKKSLLGLTDEEIKHYIINKLKEELFDTLENHLKASYEEMKKKLIEIKAKSKRTNYSDFTDFCKSENDKKIIHLFDYIQLEKIIKEVDRKNGSRTINSELKKEFSGLKNCKEEKRFRGNLDMLNYLKNLLKIC